MSLRLKTLFLIGLCLSLMACGFHLRGQGPGAILSYSSIQVIGQSPAAQELRKALLLQPSAKLVEKDGEAQVTISSESYDKQVLSVNSSGQVAEYRLFYRIHVNANEGQYLLLNDAVITLSRNLSWDENNILSKESEEANLLKEMQRDSAQQIIRRVNAASKKRAKASGVASSAASAPAASQ